MGKQSTVKMDKRFAIQVTGGLGKPSKMPGAAYGIPAKYCRTGGKLRNIKGTACETCYAWTGRYLFDNVQEAEMRRYERVLEALNNAAFRPVFVEAFVFLLKRVEWFRWHDAGDLVSVEHLAMICEIARRTPGTRHWLPTQESKDVSAYLASGGEIPDNLVIRLSGKKIDGALPHGHAAKHPALTVSGVTLIEERVTCHAQTNSPDKTCDTCRACWDREVPTVIYRKH